MSEHCWHESKHKPGEMYATFDGAERWRQCCHCGAQGIDDSSTEWNEHHPKGHGSHYVEWKPIQHNKPIRLLRDEPVDCVPTVKS